MKPRIKYAAVLCLSGLLSACVSDSHNEQDSSTRANDFDNLAMLTNLADMVIIPSYQRVLEQLDPLLTKEGTEEGSIQRYCQALGSNQEDAALAIVGEDWLAAAEAWQRTELWQLMPVQAVRDNVFAYDETLSLSTCGVDQAVLLAEDNVGFSIVNRAVNQRGFTALEYVLFNRDLNHTCPPQIVETQSWSNRTELARKQLRCAYAHTIAQDINDTVSLVVNSWSIDGGNYRSVFLNPQNGAKSIADVSDALFYLDTVVKDIKVGRTIGVHQSCNQRTCAEQVESPFLQASYHLIDSNLQGFLQIYQGANALGLDDYIAFQGFSGVNEQMLLLLNNARTLLADQDQTLVQHTQAINSDLAVQACANDSANPTLSPVHVPCALHGYLKRMTDLLKIDVITILNTNLPQSAQSDND